MFISICHQRSPFWGLLLLQRHLLNQMVFSSSLDLWKDIFVYEAQMAGKNTAKTIAWVQILILWNYCFLFIAYISKEGLRNTSRRGAEYDWYTAHPWSWSQFSIYLSQCFPIYLKKWNHKKCRNIHTTASNETHETYETHETHET